MTTTLDRECLGAIRSAPRSALSWYLMASCLYYHADHSLLSDSLYDRLAKDLLADWDTLEHQHKHLVTREDLKAGTLYAMPLERYPWIVRCAATRLAGPALTQEQVDGIIADYSSETVAPAKAAPRVRERTRSAPAPVPAAPRVRHRERPKPAESVAFMPNVPRIRTRPTK